jgi:hypothetical protein
MARKQVTAPAWLTPTFASTVGKLPVKRARTVKDDDLAAKAANKAMESRKYRKWWHSPKGRAWLEANRERRNAYHLRRYHENPERKAYSLKKTREYRAARRANG